MEQEIRIPHIGYLQQAMQSHPHVISIGHEGCLGRLPDINDALRVGEVCKLKLVLPKVGQSSINAVCKYIETISTSLVSLEVTVNDYGMLRALQNIKNIAVFAGRMLIKAFEEHPYAEEVSMRYPSEWRKNIMQSNILEYKKMMLLRSYGVCGVEMNILTHTRKAIGEVQETFGLAIHAISDRLLLAAFRTCPVARFHHSTYPECLKGCRNLIHLKHAPNGNLETQVGSSALDGFLDGNIMFRHLKRNSGKQGVQRQIHFIQVVGSEI